MSEKKRDKLIRLSELQSIPIRMDHYDEENGKLDFILGIETAIEYAENLPDAIVQCEECEHRMTESPDGWCVCDKVVHNGVDYLPDHQNDWFCADGSQKKDLKKMPNNFKALIKLGLEKTGMKKQDLAKKVGTTPVSIGRYAKALRVPDWDMAMKILDALGYEVEIRMKEDNV